MLVTFVNYGCKKLVTLVNYECKKLYNFGPGPVLLHRSIKESLRSIGFHFHQEKLNQRKWDPKSETVPNHANIFPNLRRSKLERLTLQDIFNPSLFLNLKVTASASLLSSSAPSNQNLRYKKVLQY